MSAPSLRIVEELNTHAEWRSALAADVRELERWLEEEGLREARTAQAIARLLERLAEDRLLVALVAEFSRGKSELINALFFADLGGRVLPSSAGRTTMCPTEILHDPALGPCLRLLPIETRARGLPVSEYRKFPDEWETHPLDLASTESLAAALARVGDTRRVGLEQAHALGFAPEEEMPGTEATVEIPRWRHAIVSLPHPLLEQGLVILDTPGLNALGNEPDLTLNLLPSAHAVLFVLAADAGVTRTDAAVWRDHIADAHSGTGARLVVLNKVDALWDELRRPEEVDAQIERQAAEAATRLGVGRAQVFPVSARTALLARIRGEESLLERSRLPALEQALAGSLVAGRQEIIAQACRRELGEIVAGLRELLEARRAGAAEQLAELTGLRDKSQDVVAAVHGRARDEKQHFDRSLQRYTAVRNIFHEHALEALRHLGRDAARGLENTARAAMKEAAFTPALRAAIAGFFDGAREQLAKADAQLFQARALMDAEYEQLAREHGIERFRPRPFSMLRFEKEIARLERACNVQLNTLWNMASSAKQTVMARFFDTVAGSMRYVFEACSRESNSWLAALMDPMESRVREREARLRRRLESVRRIHEAREELEDRIEEIGRIEREAAAHIARVDAFVSAIGGGLSPPPRTATAASR